MLNIGMILSLAIVVTCAGFAMHTPQEKGTYHPVTPAILLAINGTSSNGTPGIDSEMNAFIIGVGGPGGFGTFAFPNATAQNPSLMLSTMYFYLQSPSNSTASVKVGKAFAFNAQFAWSKTVKATVPDGISTITVNITSGLLGITRTITFNVSVLSYTTFVAYQEKIIKSLQSYTSYVTGGLIALAAFLAITFFRTWLPIAKAVIQDSNRKTGMVLLARN